MIAPSNHTGITTFDDAPLAPKIAPMSRTMKMMVSTIFTLLAMTASVLRD